jgi:multidrug efflux system membrane fusion protein
VNRYAILPLLATSACITLTSCSRLAATTNTVSTDTVPIRAAIAATQDVPLEISAVGNVEAIESVDVKSRIPGQIRSVAFEEGQNVTKGELLFALDLEPLQRQVAEQQAVLDRDIAMEQQARAVVARDAASQKQSESEVDVARKLGTLGVLSGQRVNQLVTTNDTATAALRSDQAAVEAAVSAIKADRARLSQMQLQLSFASIVAPISGRAGAAMVRAGNVVRESDTTLVTIHQLAPIHVTFGIPEQTLSEVQQLYARGPLTVEASSGSSTPLEGRLDFIDNAVDATTGTIRLKAKFSNTNDALWPGQFVNIRLRLRIDKAKTLIPESAVQDGLDGKYVWRVQSGIASTNPVTVLRTYKPESGPGLAIISSGLQTGDTVVTEGQLRLTPGAKVSFLDKPHAAQIKLAQ